MSSSFVFSKFTYSLIFIVKELISYLKLPDYYVGWFYSEIINYNWDIYVCKFAFSIFNSFICLKYTAICC